MKACLPTNGREDMADSGFGIRDSESSLIKAYQSTFAALRQLSNPNRHSSLVIRKALHFNINLLLLRPPGDHPHENDHADGVQMRAYLGWSRDVNQHPLIQEIPGIDTVSQADQRSHFRQESAQRKYKKWVFAENFKKFRHRSTFSLDFDPVDQVSDQRCG